MLGPGTFRTPAYFVFGTGGLVSYALLLAFVLWSAFVLDAALGALARARFALAGAAAVFVAYTLVSAWTLEVTSVGSLDLLFAFGFDLGDLLRELDLGPSWLLALPVALLGSFASGGLLHRGLTRYAPPRWAPAVAVVATLALLVTFAVEQFVARAEDPHYPTRKLALPVYVQLFAPAGEAVALALPAPRSAAERAQELADIRPAANPRHVLFLLLESLRRDVVSPEEMPTLAHLETDSVRFPRARTEAIFSPASWTVLLLDESSLTRLWERAGDAPTDRPGPWPLDVMRAAGYAVWVSFSGSLIEGFDALLLGQDAPADRAYTPPDDVYAGHLRDDLATARLIEWIGALDPRTPHMMLLQLDATHFPYTFHEEEAVYRPFSPAVLPHHLDDQREIDLVHTRYRNAARHVDAKVAAVLARLDERGVLGDTAIVAVSDHGEGFTEGRVGHTVLHDEIERVPMFMKLPGVPPREVDAIVPTGHVWPTLCAYLGIAATFRRPPALDVDSLPSVAASHSPLMNLVDLAHAGGAIRFFVRRRDGAVELVPFAAFDAEGRFEGDWRAAAADVPWREMLRVAVAEAGVE